MVWLCWTNIFALRFEDDFLFGASTSAYQIEGAWNTSGKGPSVCDDFTHDFPERILDGSNGDVATDLYHLFQKDLAALKYLGASAYRFSLSWTRLLPTGYINESDPDGIRYYNMVIDELLANGIEPVVTIYHWDAPSTLQKLGGFTNRDTIPIFVDYALFCFEQFGDRVKTWITFNEINIICSGGHAYNVIPPGVDIPGYAEYLCAHNMLLANGYTYRLYHEKLESPYNGGKIGLAVNLAGYFSPSDDPMNIYEAEVGQEFYAGWILNPVFSEEGDYPRIMKDYILAKSLSQNYRRSRLPEFTPQEVQMLIGSSDFLGINVYTTYLFTFVPINDTTYATKVDVKILDIDDFPLLTYRLVEWPYGDYPTLSSVPSAVRDLLMYVKNKYANPPVLISESGYAERNDGPNLNDCRRVDYNNRLISEILSAISRHGCNVYGYLQWSLIDNWEWNNGYTVQYGLFYVDRNSELKNRVGRLSSRVYKNIIETHEIDLGYLPYINGDADIF